MSVKYIAPSNKLSQNFITITVVINKVKILKFIVFSNNGLSNPHGFSSGKLLFSQYTDVIHHAIYFCNNFSGDSRVNCNILRSWQSTSENTNKSYSGKWSRNFTTDYLVFPSLSDIRDKYQVQPTLSCGSYAL